MIKGALRGLASTDLCTKLVSTVSYFARVRADDGGGANVSSPALPLTTAQDSGQTVEAQLLKATTYVLNGYETQA